MNIMRKVRYEIEIPPFYIMVVLLIVIAVVGNCSDNKSVQKTQTTIIK